MAQPCVEQAPGSPPSTQWASDSIIGSLGEKTMEANSQQALNSEPSQSTGQAQAPTPSPGIRTQNRTWPGGPKSRPLFCQKICQMSTKTTGQPFAEQILGWENATARSTGKNLSLGAGRRGFLSVSASSASSSVHHSAGVGVGEWGWGKQGREALSTFLY